ncbi:site-specific integrase [Alteriqipengyuania flavescens]|uniref:tyrosine-type recombinase/integrase n=1 Tax=Alteriqipengyuania flavescens TaxID=3053610 RepID=UPI0025B5FF5B|nr:site-specific integrase [Alteriqipengyuania flavescens]WJY17694.1 site-specific integrase [Alteriqipengyuania flavescens]WJY23637.1 site-specific integrase [Alteriqipengyuania flavescens]
MKIRTKPSGIHFIEVRLPDPATGELKRSRVSLDTRDMDEAKRQRADWLAGTHPKHPRNGGIIAAKGRGPDASTKRISTTGVMTVARWLDVCQTGLWRTCKSQSTIQSNVRLLTQALDDAGHGELALADIASTHVTAIEAQLRDRHNYAEASVKKLMGSLRAALNAATTEEDPKTGKALLLRAPNFPTYKVRNIRDRVLSDAEEEAVFACIAQRIEDEPSRPWRQMGLLLTVMLDTGFRIGEALSVGPASVTTKRWIDPVTKEGRSATFLGLARYTTKNDKPREVPLSDRVISLLPTLNALSIKGRWFPWKPGSGGPGYLWLNLRADMEERGFDLSDVTLHTMRHTCATRLALGGMDLLGLRDWLGHSDIKITAERYVHLMSSHLYQGAAILNLAGGTSSLQGETEEPDGEPCGKPDSLSCGNYGDPRGALALH